MIRRLTSTALIAIATFGSALPAQAQKIALGLEHRSGNLSFGISFGKGRPDPQCHSLPPPCPNPGGSWEIIEEKVWVPGRESKIWVQPIYETWYDSCGNRQTRLISPGYWKKVCEAGHFEIQRRKVWVPNYYPSGRIFPRR